MYYKVHAEDISFPFFQGPSGMDVDKWLMEHAHKCKKLVSFVCDVTTIPP